MTLAEKITQLRKATGISQEQLAEALAVSRQSVSKWERGEAAPDIDKVVALSRFFAVSCDELLLDEGAPARLAPSSDKEKQTAQAAPHEKLAAQGELALAVQQNMALFRMKTGVQLAKAALVLAVLCCVLPYAMQMIERYLFGEFYTYAFYYLRVFPMPVLLALTVGLAGAAAAFFICAKAPKKKNEE